MIDKAVELLKDLGPTGEEAVDEVVKLFDALEVTVLALHEVLEGRDCEFFPDVCDDNPGESPCSICEGRLVLAAMGKRYGFRHLG